MKFLKHKNTNGSKMVFSFEEMENLSIAEFESFLKIFLHKTHRGNHYIFDDNLHHGVFLGTNIKEKILVGFVFHNEEWKRDDGSFYCNIDSIGILKEAAKNLAFVPSKIFLCTPHFIHKFLLHEADRSNINIFSADDFRKFFDEYGSQKIEISVQTELFDENESQEKKQKENIQNIAKFSFQKGKISVNEKAKKKGNEEKKFEKSQVFVWSTLALFAMAGFMINPEGIHMQGNISSDALKYEQCVSKAKSSSSSEIERKEKEEKCKKEKSH